MGSWSVRSDANISSHPIVNKTTSDSPCLEITRYTYVTATPVFAY